MQEFEKYPKLKEHLQSFASHGYFGIGGWSGFIEELNKALSESPDDLKAENERLKEIEKIAEKLNDRIYKQVMWETHNIKEKPSFHSYHEAMDAFNEYATKYNIFK